MVAIAAGSYHSLALVSDGPLRPNAAKGFAQVFNGFAVGVGVTAQGFGYPAAPLVKISGGGGTGATATATIQDGRVVSVVIDNPGRGYTGVPEVIIGTPPGVPSLRITVKQVAVTLSVTLGRKYQVDSSFNLRDWTPTGPVFIAEANEIIQTFDVGETGRYFRINEVPWRLGPVSEPRLYKLTGGHWDRLPVCPIGGFQPAVSK